MTLVFKPKKDRVRLIYTDGPGKVMPEYKGKVFAVIGPFEDHMDKPRLMDALEIVCRGYNTEDNGI